MRRYASVGKRSILIGTSVLVTFGILLGSRSVSRVQGQSRDIEQTIERFLVPFSNRDIPAFAEFFVEDAPMFFPSAAGPANRAEGKIGIGQQFKELYERVGPPRGTGGTIFDETGQIGRLCMYTLHKQTPLGESVAAQF